jgi:hypothetical protein
MLFFARSLAEFGRKLGFGHAVKQPSAFGVFVVHVGLPLVSRGAPLFNRMSAEVFRQKPS